MVTDGAMIDSLTIVQASAGTGKTRRLCEAYLRAVKQGISPESIVVTTFTDKAASELAERLRTRLLEDGRVDDSCMVPAGLIGTVHSICTRLIGDCALECGLSPVSKVISAEEAREVFAEAIAPIIQEHAGDIEPLAERLGYLYPSTGSDDPAYVQAIHQLVQLARSNGAEAEQVPGFARPSWDSLQACLPCPDVSRSADQRDREMHALLQQVCLQLKTLSGEDTELSRRCLERLSTGESLAWQDWISLENFGGKKSRHELKQLHQLASEHLRHPRFHDDLQRFIVLIFRCAGKALRCFSDFKRKRCLIDFIDQEAIVLHLLERSQSARDYIKGHFKLLLIDEFQDTSPLQLALFMKLKRSIGHAVWVGDAKQSIFGFRGCDPELVSAVTSLLNPLAQPKRIIEVLDCSYRSRPQLVEFSNAVFDEPTIPGIPSEQITLRSARDEPSGLDCALQYWQLPGSNWTKAATNLAHWLAKILAHDEQTSGEQILVASGDRIKAIQPEDIAILCRQNRRCNEVAQALKRRGIAVATSAEDVTSTPEGMLSLAALRYLVDPGDRLAIATLVHLTTEDSQLDKDNQDGGSTSGESFAPVWLDLALRTWSSERWRELSSSLKSLDGLRQRRLDLTPLETMESVISELSLSWLVSHWGRHREGHANLEILYQLARAYQDECRSQMRAATTGGLVMWLNRRRFAGNDALKSNGAPKSAVSVLTYHHSKGLEWPMVILLDLHAGQDDHDDLRQLPLGTCVLPAKRIDPERPLCGRRLNFWPWPYGSKKKYPPWQAHLGRTEQAMAHHKARRAELIRLLYVGITRARDYLVFAVRMEERGKRDQQSWLSMLSDHDGTSILSHPGRRQGLEAFRVRGRDFPVKVTIAAVEGEQLACPTVGNSVWHAISQPRGHARTSTDINQSTPSKEVVFKPLHCAEQALPLKPGCESKMRLLGEAIHGFLAADRQEYLPQKRQSMAARLLANCEVDQAVEPLELLKGADFLWDFISQHWPKASVQREVVVVTPQSPGAQKIDLLLEDADGFVIIDHKTFPSGDFEQRKRHFVKQLISYCRAVERGSCPDQSRILKQVKQCLIHATVERTIYRMFE